MTSNPSDESAGTGAMRQSSVSGRARSTTRSFTCAASTWLFNTPAVLSTSSARVPGSTWCTAPSGVVTATVAICSTHPVRFIFLVPASSPKRHAASVGRSATRLVGTGGIEPPTSSVSRKRSPTELRACVLRPALPTPHPLCWCAVRARVSTEGPTGYQFRRTRSRNAVSRTNRGTACGAARGAARFASVRLCC